MTAELFTGSVVQVTLGGRVDRRPTLEHLLAVSEHVIAHEIDADGLLTAYLKPGAGDIAFVNALSASGMYPLETYYYEAPSFGGPRAD